MNQLTAGSLFSGIGGIDLAFVLAGFNILFQVEIDDFCQKVLAKHGPTYWPNAEIHSDVCRVGRHNLPSVDVLFGGFPCQDISNAGKRAGIRDGQKSGLWREFKRIIGELRPRVVFLENVPTITVKGRGGIDVITDLTQMGYDCRWGVISAADAGAPHQRDRWFCVGYTNGQRHSQSAAASKLCADEERHDSSSQSQRYTVFYAPVSNGEVEHTNGEQCQEQHLTAKRGNARFSGGRSGPDELETVEHSDGEYRSSVGLSSVRGQSAVAARGSSQDGFEAGGVTDQSSMDRTTHGVSRRMDGHQLMAHRWPSAPHQPQHEGEQPRMAPGDDHTIDRIRALGNAVVPQCVYPSAVEIRRMLSDRR